MESLVRPSNNLIQCIFLIVQFYSIDMVRLGGDFCVVVVVVVEGKGSVAQVERTPSPTARELSLACEHAAALYPL